ncbi:MAG TPA: hypothetical protein VFI97_08240 [Arthrobacter sp.]|nr:hypothetical protein [Arthrobacter sp.]
MPITSNVEWDGRLEAFKGRDTTAYAEATAAMAKVCAACRLALVSGEPLSLTVAVAEGIGTDGTAYVTFDPVVSHRRCREPGLTLHEATGVPEELTTRGMRITLEDRDSSGSWIVPALAYTLIPSVSIREPGGGLVSVLVSVLLSQGFQLCLNADYAHILQVAGAVKDSFGCSITEQGLVTLHADGEQMYSQQLDPRDPDQASWLEAAREGALIVMSGDNLDFTETGPSFDVAARLGTLVAGRVPVRTSP